MWNFLCLLLLCGFFIWRVEPLLKKPPTVVPKPVEPMPVDLLAYAQGFDSEWARDQAVDRLRELYAKLGDWMMVRRAVAQSDVGLSVMEVVER